MTEKKQEEFFKGIKFMSCVRSEEIERSDST